MPPRKSKTGKLKIAILGFGREGRSLLRLLRNRRLTRKSARIDAEEIWILDKSSQKVPRGIKTQFGNNYLKNLKRFDIIFRSPGVPYNLPELVKARRAGVKFSSATKLFFDEISRLTTKTSHLAPSIIGITGTKGKGTTATLLYKMLHAAKKRAFLAGNIGKPALDIIPRLKKNSWVILELSSFQLQDLKTSPHIAVVLDIFPDHQDKHFSLAEYYMAKTNIAKYQKKDDGIFFLEKNKLSGWVARRSAARKIPVNEGNFGLFRAGDLKIIGGHNFKNAVMAATVAGYLGVPAKTIIKTAKNFHGLPHRLQLVRTIITKTAQPNSNVLKNIRIEFYNDSAAVNPGATIAALKTFAGENVILIAGGLERGLDYSGLAKAIKKYAKFVVLFGENKREIAKATSGRWSVVSDKKKTQIIFAKTLKEAVQKAYRCARSLITNHLSLITILFSPASASFDMFKNYEERGEEFTKIVKKIKSAH